jgi:hypothetical protein
MNNGDKSVGCTELTTFVSNARLIPDQHDFVLAERGRRLDRSTNDLFRGVIPSHRVDADSHGSLRLLFFERQGNTTADVTTITAGGMRPFGHATFRAGRQVGSPQGQVRTSLVSACF